MRRPGLEPGPPAWKMIRPLAKVQFNYLIRLPDNEEGAVRRPGLEPGPPAWKAGILTTRQTAHMLMNFSFLQRRSGQRTDHDLGTASKMSLHPNSSD